MGIEISRQNLSNWMIKGANLLKSLYNQIKSSLMNEELLHVDQTVLEILNEPGREATSKSYVLIYRTSKYNTHPAVVYEYTTGRNGDFIRPFYLGGKEHIFTAIDILVTKSLKIKYCVAA